MKKDSFQNALIAAAKITCCASIFGLGCEKKSPSIAEPANDSPENIEQTEKQAEKQAEKTAQAPETTSKESKVYDDECKQLIKETYPNEDVWLQSEDVSQEVKDCCQLAAEYYDKLREEGNWNALTEWDERNQCCGSALDWRTNTSACTPWGPPMPPKFKSAKIHRPQQLQRILTRTV